MKEKVKKIIINYYYYLFQTYLNYLTFFYIKFK